MIFHPEARREAMDAALYYERQEAGLGDRFSDAIEAGLRQIQRSPFMWRCIRGDSRRFLVKTFPYGIVYLPMEENLFVLAVMHLHREPDYWRKRLRDLP